ncbi:glycosyltransferase family 4 protein [Formosa sp. 3Alg 14/1]|uniref:glycosyltransferase family 4 protein n=1 Tax=Formosa sp. 3Alg 14/1 TaxID=3382190 RepID=UPI0039BDBF53
MAKTIKILLSEHGLPDTKNGSWTQRLKYFLESNYNIFDHVICGPTTSKQRLNKVKTTYCKVINNRFLLKLFPNIKFKNFMNSLKEIIANNDNVIVCVMDNIRLNNELSLFLEQNNFKSKVSVVFYNCGYSYFLEDREHKMFCRNIDRIIFLTQSAYEFNKAKYSELIPEVSVLHNPVDKNLFKLISKEAKTNLLQDYNLQEKTVFLWLSHNRPKKGLKIILKAWSIWAKERTDVELLIVGVDCEDRLENVKFLGKIPSDKVDTFYKLAHIYLFPTLWKEGYGLSLAQAICSGCYCLTATNGGVKDFMFKTDGEFIEHPNFIKDWISGMEKAYQDLKGSWENDTAGSQILSLEQWSEKFADIIVNSEK